MSGGPGWIWAFTVDERVSLWLNSGAIFEGTVVEVTPCLLILTKPYEPRHLIAIAIDQVAAVSRAQP